MELKDLRGLAIAIMIIGLVLGVGFLLLREFGDTMGDTAGTITNETVNFTTGRGIYVSRNHTNRDCFNDFAVVNVYNKTVIGDAAPVLLVGNYSYEVATGRIWNLSSDMNFVPASFSWLVSYTFEYSNSSACMGIEETVIAAAEIQEWLGIIVILFIVGILMFIVYRFMGGAPTMPGGKGMKPGRFKGFGGLGGGGDSGSAEI